jgi:hypothetical protein
MHIQYKQLCDGIWCLEMKHNHKHTHPTWLIVALDASLKNRVFYIAVWQAEG